MVIHMHKRMDWVLFTLPLQSCPIVMHHILTGMFRSIAILIYSHTKGFDSTMHLMTNICVLNIRVFRPLNYENCHYIRTFTCNFVDFMFSALDLPI